jgi:hypothetical protein
LRKLQANIINPEELAEHPAPPCPRTHVTSALEGAPLGLEQNILEVELNVVDDVGHFGGSEELGRSGEICRVAAAEEGTGHESLYS